MALIVIMPLDLVLKPVPRDLKPVLGRAPRGLFLTRCHQRFTVSEV